MKEIDFLPEWYKSSRRQQVSYRRQVIGLSSAFVVMLVWNFMATSLVSKTTAEFAGQQWKQVEAERISQKFSKIKGRVTELQEKAGVLEGIDSRIDVSNVLAEMSFLIDEKIVLSKVEFKSERFSDRRSTTAGGGSAVRVAGGGSGGKRALSFGDVRFKIVLNGVAADGGDVAKLICRLEDSPYFCQVVPSFSRNDEIKTGTDVAGGNFQISKFEISCYLSNYVEG